MSSTPVTRADVDVRGACGARDLAADAAVPRVRELARERLALMAFSAAMSAGLALTLLALAWLGN